HRVNRVRVNRRKTSIRAFHFDADDAATGGFAAIPTKVQTGNLREAPGSGFDLRDAIFERGDHIRTLELEGTGEIAEGQNGRHAPKRDLHWFGERSLGRRIHADRNIAANAAAVLDNDLRAGFRTHCVGEQVAEIAFLNAANGAVADEEDRRFADRSLFQF